MSAVKILWGQVIMVFLIVVLTAWSATEWTGWRLGFQPQLGPPWFELFHLPFYRPPSFFWWWFAYDAYGTDRVHRLVAASDARRGGYLA